MVFISNEKLHVSAYSGHLQVLTTFLLKEFYIICLNRVVMLRSHHHLPVLTGIHNHKQSTLVPSTGDILNCY